MGYVENALLSTEKEPRQSYTNQCLWSLTIISLTGRSLPELHCVLACMFLWMCKCVCLCMLQFLAGLPLSLSQTNLRKAKQQAKKLTSRLASSNPCLPLCSSLTFPPLCFCKSDGRGGLFDVPRQPGRVEFKSSDNNVKQKRPSVSFAKRERRSASTAAARRRLKCCQEHFRGGAWGACSQWGADKWGRVGGWGSAVSPLPASSGPAGRMWRETHSGRTVRNTAAEHNVHVVQYCAAPCCLKLGPLMTADFYFSTSQSLIRVLQSGVVATWYATINNH